MMVFAAHLVGCKSAGFRIWIVTCYCFEENLENVLGLFMELLLKVKDFLEQKGAFELIDDLAVGSEPEGEVLELSMELVKDLQVSMNNVNLKRCEEIINGLCKVNYGSEYNHTILEMKNAYDMFDYHKVKECIEVLVN